MLMITSKNASIYYLNTSRLSLMYSPQNDYQGIALCLHVLHLLHPEEFSNG